jgi:OmpA-OmpF porin, OOP family
MIRGVCAVLAVFALAIPVASQAQPVSGFYVGGEGGLALPQQQNLDVSRTHAGSPPGSAAARAEAEIQGSNADGSGSVGWGAGDGLRLEAQGIQMGRSNTGLAR